MNEVHDGPARALAMYQRANSDTRNSETPTDEALITWLVDEIVRLQHRLDNAQRALAIAEDMMGRVARHAQPRTAQPKTPRWQVIRDTFTVPQSSAREMCRHFGLDPDEEL